LQGVGDGGIDLTTKSGIAAAAGGAGSK